LQTVVNADTTSDTVEKDSITELEEKTGMTAYELFAACYLPHHLSNDTPAGAKVLCKNAPMHGVMCNHFRKSNRCVLVAPAKFAKSTWGSVIQPLTDGALGLVNGDILLISNTGRLAEHWLDIIKEEILHNKDILNIFGNLKGGVWRQDRIKLRTGIEICSLGLQYQIRGTGWAKIICDDMENKEIMESDNQREKFSEWFDADLLGRMHPHSQLTKIGTFLHPLCKIKKMYDNLDGRYDAWVRMKYAALDENGQSTWPDRWPTEVIEQQRIEMGEKAFLSEKMNEPIFGTDHIFRPEWIKYYG